MNTIRDVIPWPDAYAQISNKFIKYTSIEKFIDSLHVSLRRIVFGENS